jgi:hypothetical protein
MRNWQPAHTAPTNGDEFYYLTRGDDAVRTGSLGPNIQRDLGMTAWHPKTASDQRPPDPPYGGICVP